MDEIIRVENLKKTYIKFEGFRKKEIHALKGVSFKVYDGEVFGLVGPNGAGKSTLLKILMGFLLPDSGSAWIDGEPIGSISTRAKIGFLPEMPYFHDFIPASRLLGYIAKLAKVSGADYNELLAYVGLKNFEKYTLRSYSKGMKQRFGIAQMLLGNPKLLIIDEPTSGLDPLGQYEILTLIKRIKDEGGHTIFFTTHYLREVELLCDRIAVIHLGQILFEGTPMELRLRYSTDKYILQVYSRELASAETELRKLFNSFSLVRPDEMTGIAVLEGENLLTFRIESEELGKIAQMPHNIELRQLRKDIVSLEEAFFKLIEEYREERRAESQTA